MYHKTHWTVDKIARRLDLIQPLVYRKHLDLPPFQFTELPDPLIAPLLGDQMDRSHWTTIAPNSHWGRRFLDFMLHTSFAAPAEWSGQAVALYLPLGEAGDFSHPEALAYVDGVPYAACDRHHQEILLPAAWLDGRTHSLDLHGWTGLLGDPTSDPDVGLYMRPCALVVIDQPTRDFIITARTALDTARHLDANQPAKGHLLNALDAAFKVLDTREPLGESYYLSLPPDHPLHQQAGAGASGEAFYASVEQAHAVLKRGIAIAGAPLDVSVVGAGHAHIDTAWLWTLGQTRRKAGRTFHTVMRLMEQFPNYHFTQSQPQLYEFVREDYPALFEAIKERAKEGRWEPIGGMWVEADCNLSGPESLARQFLLGRAFFRKHFGPNADTRVLWLPDVFGYAWNLPQLIKEAGLEYFFTIKIGWSQYNRLPYDSFWWQGLDGTKVLTHFSTTPEPGSVFASTYNAQATAEQNLGTWRNFQQKEHQQELFMAFGFGDGGGGPTREMLENIEEMKAFPGLPQMRNGSVADFYDNLAKTSGHLLPTWNGELYLELHRGTYTTQSRNKRANRKSEFLLHDAELLASLASLANADYAYPAERLTLAWQTVCLNQFHDIIPGSSIGPVYVESQEQYAEVAAIAEDVSKEALAALGGGRNTLLVANPTSFVRSDLAFWVGDLGDDQHVTTKDGHVVMTQATEGGLWIDAGALPPNAVTALSIASGTAPQSQASALVATPHLLENEFLAVELNADGDITRIFDKVNGREVLPQGAIANQFQAHEDRPNNWDAWDVDIFVTDKTWTAEPAASVRVVEAGPLRAALEIRRRILHSEYTQTISLQHNSARLDVDTQIDWRERHIMLKVAFPVDVLSPTATYEIQWGNTERPTHRNSSWDWARFETCAQKWVDLSEGGYGVSLINDCKYGHDIKDNVMRISLLRSPTSPDPEADQGEHRFAYSLLPHSGGWDERTVAAAYALNDPLLVVRGAKGNSGADWFGRSLVSVDAPNVVIETVKAAEDGNGLIVRFYETQRKRGLITLTTAFPVASAQRTNLLEETQTDLVVDGNQVIYAIRPYEIATLRLVAK